MDLLKIRLFADAKLTHKDYEAGEKVNIQIMRVGKWKHPTYGEVKITPEDLQLFKKNFDENKRGVELAVDENHEDDHKALGRFKELIVQAGEALHATIELTKLGAEILSKGAYRYFSPEFFPLYKDEENGDIIKNLLVGGAFTNRPFFKAMSPLTASEESMGKDIDDKTFLYGFKTIHMNKITNILAAFYETGKIDKSTQAELKQMYGEMKEEDKDPRLVGQVTDALQYSETEDAPADPVTPAPEDKGEDAPEEDTPEVETPEAPEAPAPEAPQEHNEQVVSIQASELQRLQAAEAKLAMNEVTAKVSSFAFSEKTKSGAIITKAHKSAVDFALSLSEAQRNKFYEFLKLNMFETNLFSEMGHKVDKDPTEGMDEDQKLDYQVTQYSEKHNVDYEVAFKAVTNHS